MVDNKHEDDLCDVKQVTGQYPAFTGFDFYQMDSDWIKTVTYLTKKAYSRGMVVAMSWHVNNFANGGNAWSMGNEQHIVRELLPGGKHPHHYMDILDKIAHWANSLLDSKGRHIPIIFRPFHESNGGWFWWGLGNRVNNTPKDLQDIYRYTVKYLRDTKGVHNFLYAFSPGSGYKSMTEDGGIASYMAAYPGDDYVDILGLDDYGDLSATSKLQKFVDYLNELVTVAEKKDKVPALTEAGLTNSRINEVHNFWSDRVLSAIKGTRYVQKRDAAKRIAYMNTWTNYCSSTKCDLFTPYAGHPGEKYFVDFFKDPLMCFGDYVKQHDMYS
ncbi:mannan endo-1,4-beta-mannosidase [Patella vulgata]|uniref:mannan endo-1,4-beta-mannosidase n=1 Tax=Patella vulgata TaxID=6465 RepID=UPI0024A92C0A|nr:mannan endo-1,4-beta-mannosidase [Patella vulgata]